MNQIKELIHNNMGMKIYYKLKEDNKKVETNLTPISKFGDELYKVLEYLDKVFRVKIVVKDSEDINVYFFDDWKIVKLEEGRIKTRVKWIMERIEKNCLNASFEEGEVREIGYVEFY